MGHQFFLGFAKGNSCKNVTSGYLILASKQSILTDWWVRDVYCVLFVIKCNGIQANSAQAGTKQKSHQVKTRGFH